MVTHPFEYRVLRSMVRRLEVETEPKKRTVEPVAAHLDTMRFKIEPMAIDRSLRRVGLSDIPILAEGYKAPSQEPYVRHAGGMPPALNAKQMRAT